VRLEPDRLFHHRDDCRHTEHPWSDQDLDGGGGRRSAAADCRRADIRLFAAGIIGTGLLAVPVLAGSAAYAVAESFHLPGSLELPASRALGFYAIVGAATLGGAALALTNIDPIAMLFWTAVINGIIAVPIMAAMMVMVAKTRSLSLPLWLKVLAWLAAVLMAVSVALLLWSTFS
jgi:Mn2+/Fe2+ NRAMP family transporter